MERVLELLRQAQRPMAIVGGSRWDAEAVARFQDFAAAHALPVACSFRRQMLFDHQHPCYAGDLGLERSAAIIMDAQGCTGLNRDYLINTVRQLEADTLFGRSGLVALGLLIYLIAGRERTVLWRRWTLCAAAVTTVEYFTGVLVNLRLGWNVWNYADRPLNVLGQICPLYTLFWFGLAIPGVWLGRTVRQKLAARQTQ